MIACNMNISSSYHHSTFDHATRTKAVQDAIAFFANVPSEVGIVMTGLSGMLIGLIVAHQTQRPFAIVRKPKEVSHGNHVEGYVCKEYMIVDDFVDSGATVANIRKALPDRICLGVYTYSDISSGKIKDLEIYNKTRQYQSGR